MWKDKANLNYPNYLKYRMLNARKRRQRMADDPKYVLKEKHRMQRYMKKLRIDALVHYSNGQPKCFCCGETILIFLGIDHLDRKMKRVTGHGRSLYMWLRKYNYPRGFRVLCHNCNMAHGVLGYCPHELEEDKRNNVDFINMNNNKLREV